MEGFSPGSDKCVQYRDGGFCDVGALVLVVYRHHFLQYIGSFLCKMLQKYALSLAKTHFFQKKVAKCLVNSKKSVKFAPEFALSFFHEGESVRCWHISHSEVGDSTV